MEHARGPRFETSIEQSYREAFVQHGDLGLSLETFSRHILSLSEKSSREERADCLHTSDLYLAIACGSQSAAAWDRFTAIYRRYLREVASLFCRNQDAACELAANVLADLFLPGRSGRSRIATYDGRSSLATWLRVIVSRRAINENQRKFNQAECLDSLPEMVGELGEPKVEAVLRAGRYQSALRGSLAVACRRLSEEDRCLLLMRHEQDMPLGSIARRLGVHQSTVTRQLQRIYAVLRRHVVNVLATKYHMDPLAIEECMAAAAENQGNSLLSPLLWTLRQGAEERIERGLQITASDLSNYSKRA